MSPRSLPLGWCCQPGSPRGLKLPGAGGCSAAVPVGELGISGQLAGQGALVAACVLQLVGSLGSSAGRAPTSAQYQITVVTAWYLLAGAGSLVPTRLLGHGLGAEDGAAVAPEGRGDGVAGG